MATLVPLMPCASTGILSGQSYRLLNFLLRGGLGGLVQIFSCLALSVPVWGLSDVSPADFSSLRLCLVDTTFLVIGTGVPVMLFLLFWAILRSTGGDGLHSSESIETEKRSVFLFLLPRSRLAGPCFRSVGLSSSWLEWGGGASTCGGFWGASRSRSCLLRPVGSPRFKRLGCRATWSPWLLVSQAFASVHVQVACSFRCRSCSSHPSPSLFSLAKTSASWV